MPGLLLASIENDLMSKSSRQPRSRILGVISIVRAEQLLTEWVNTDLTGMAGANGWERLFQRYPEILPIPISDIVPVREANFDRFHQQMEMAEAVAAGLGRAWDAADLRHFEWYTWKTQLEYEWEAASTRHNLTPSHLMSQPDEARKVATAILESEEPPVIITPVEAAIFHLRRNRKRALHCPNPDCPAPYFFASKKGQKYCSSECAKPSQRESKRRWWAENRAKKVPKTRVSDRRSK
jgi:hypothetical protein